MKKGALIESLGNKYLLKLKFSTLVELRDRYNIDVLSVNMNSLLEDDPYTAFVIFWKCLESGEKKTFTEQEVEDIFDDYMEETGYDEYAFAIHDAMSIKRGYTKETENKILKMIEENKELVEEANEKNQ